MFDSKLTWGPQVTNALSKSAKALNALRLVGRFFSKKQLIQLVTSNFYSILYYNSEVWHIKNLKQSLKNSILSALAKALKLCLKNYDPYISFENLHKIADRATPNSQCTKWHCNYTRLLTTKYLQLNESRPIKI